jgi:putative molybdopterin biosynthesis protein
MNTREVAAYLRVKERKVYDLVRKRRIPCTRVTGKWLFPKHLIDLWIARNSEFANTGQASTVVSPLVVVGSHDPLLEWSLREARCELAMLAGGSLDGLRKLAGREAMIGGLHIFDSDSGEYNVPAVKQAMLDSDVVIIEWAWREQGLVLAPGNPLGIRAFADLRDKHARVVQRQTESGSQILFTHLLSQTNIKPAELNLLSQPARSESDLGLLVLEGKADAGVAIAAVSRQFRLEFIPLHRERFDLVLRRRDYFEPPFQKLLEFARSPVFSARAVEMGGYDVHGLGRVVYNGS